MLCNAHNDVQRRIKCAWRSGLVEGVRSLTGRDLTNPHGKILK
jgi:hypothetical protein